MIGSFRAGDSLRVYRLQRKGISLDLRRSLTQAPTPLWEAWLALLTQQAMGQPTYVLYDLHDGEGFIQVRYRRHQAAADVVFLAPALSAGRRGTAAWSRLLDAACVQEAGRGIQRVFANLPESGAEREVFQQAGFTLYATEDVYRLVEPRAGVIGEGEPPSLRPQRPEDWPALQKLCVAVTPQRVRQAEGGIAFAATGEKSCQRYVLPGENGHDLAAAASICTGGQAHWLRILMHPDARDLVDGVIRWSVHKLSQPSGYAIYCNVRQYEGGVRSALEAGGFELYHPRAQMVRHTMAWSKTPIQELAQGLASSAEAAPPAYRFNGESDLQSPDGRLAASHDT